MKVQIARGVEASLRTRANRGEDRDHGHAQPQRILPHLMGRIHLGTIFGTTITLDFSFLILIVFFVMTDIQAVGMRYALLWVPVLLISILWHELAHAAMIGALGFGSSSIILEGI